MKNKCHSKTNTEKNIIKGGKYYGYRDPKPPKKNDLWDNLFHNYEKLWICSVFAGGIMGSWYCGKKAYNDTRNKSFVENVSETTVMTMYGFVLGAGTGLLTPILAPVAIVVSTIRYFDSSDKMV